MSPLLRSWLLSMCSASVLVLAGCGGEGQATQTACPSDNTLTAASFGTDFMSRYCTRCHATKLSGLARQGAPQAVNLDDLAVVRSWSKQIDKEAGASTSVANLDMPPNGAAPSVDERRALSQWLACGAPE